MDAYEARGGFAHGVFVEREWVMQDVAVDRGGNYFAAIDAVAVDFAVRGPASIELRAGFFRVQDADGGREDGVQGALKFLRG